MAELEKSPTPRRRMGRVASEQHHTAPYETQQVAEAMAAKPAAPARRRMGSPALSDTSSVTPSTNTAGTAAQPTSGQRRRMGASEPSAVVEDLTSAPRIEVSQPQGAASPQQDTIRPTKDRSKRAKTVLRVVALVVIALVVVLMARWLRTLTGVEAFIAHYDGHASQPDTAPSGIPAWLGWQHFFNMFFMTLIVRTGLQIRLQRKPSGYWTPKQRSFFSPGNQRPKKVSIAQWLHQYLDVLWVLNGLVFMVLLFVTDQWMRIVPTSWDIFPNMLSAGIQYASLDWPAEHGWVHYNALQVAAYFVTVFIAAPLAVISGIRLSTWWPADHAGLNKLYPVDLARALHFPIMLYFVGFTVVHVFLVFFTGALRNLNHMYTSRDVVDFWGLVIFLVTLLAIAGAWLLTRPVFLGPVASLTGKTTKS